MTLKPPAEMTPELTHSPHYRRALQIPGTRTDEERASYRKKVDWFHKGPSMGSPHRLAFSALTTSWQRGFLSHA